MSEDQNKGKGPRIEISEAQKAELPKKFVVIGPATKSSPPETLQVRLNEEDIELKVDGQSTILECLIDQGYSPPYSCMEGNCMSCIAKVVEGAVYQHDPGILFDENIENCEALTCQSRPLTSLVKVRYDDV